MGQRLIKSNFSFAVSRFFFGDLHRHCREEDIRNLFSPFGEIDQMCIRDGPPQKGQYAFVTFFKMADAIRAHDQNQQTVLNGSKLEIKFAIHKNGFATIGSGGNRATAGSGGGGGSNGSGGTYDNGSGGTYDHYHYGDASHHSGSHSHHSPSYSFATESTFSLPPPPPTIPSPAPYGGYVVSSDDLYRFPSLSSYPLEYPCEYDYTHSIRIPPGIHARQFRGSSSPIYPIPHLTHPQIARPPPMALCDISSAPSLPSSSVPLNSSKKIRGNYQLLVHHLPSLCTKELLELEIRRHCGGFVPLMVDTWWTPKTKRYMGVIECVTMEEMALLKSKLGTAILFGSPIVIKEGSHRIHRVLGTNPNNTTTSTTTTTTTTNSTSSLTTQKKQKSRSRSPLRRRTDSTTTCLSEPTTCLSERERDREDDGDREHDGYSPSSPGRMTNPDILPLMEYPSTTTVSSSTMTQTHDTDIQSALSSLLKTLKTLPPASTISPTAAPVCT